MGLYADQRSICAPYMKLVEPLNEKMRNEAVALAKRKGFNLDLNKVGTFSAVYGKDYDRTDGSGIVFYGRANNGWDEETEDFRMTDITEQSRRPFFNLIKSVSEHYYDDWQDRIAWCNAYKMTPCCDYEEDCEWMFQNAKNTNPSALLMEIQEPVATEITKLEQDFLNPMVSILVTGYNVNDTWANTIWRNYPNYRQIGEDIVWHENARNKYMAGLYESDGRMFIQTDRPEFRPIGEHAEALIELIERAKTEIVSRNGKNQ